MSNLNTITAQSIYGLSNRNAAIAKISDSNFGISNVADDNSIRESFLNLINQSNKVDETQNNWRSQDKFGFAGVDIGSLILPSQSTKVTDNFAGGKDDSGQLDTARASKRDGNNDANGWNFRNDSSAKDSREANSNQFDNVRSDRNISSKSENDYGSKDHINNGRDRGERFADAGRQESSAAPNAEADNNAAYSSNNRSLASVALANSQLLQSAGGNLANLAAVGAANLSQNGASSSLAANKGVLAAGANGGFKIGGANLAGQWQNNNLLASQNANIGGKGKGLGANNSSSLDNFLQNGRFDGGRPAWLSDFIGQISLSKLRSQGTQQFNIQLKPISLGEVQIRLEAQSDGKLSLQLQASSPEALEILSRDHKDLVRDLHKEGGEINFEDISFNLSDNENEKDGTDYHASSQNSDRENDGGFGGMIPGLEIPGLRIESDILSRQQIYAKLPDGAGSRIDVAF